jgi:uncharacterized protein
VRVCVGLGGLDLLDRQAVLVAQPGAERGRDRHGRGAVAGGLVLSGVGDLDLELVQQRGVFLNKAMSLIVVLTALPTRLVTVPYADLASHWSVIVNLLGGSVGGAWLGATWATRMRSAILHRVLAALLAVIAVVLAWSHVSDLDTVPFQLLPGRRPLSLPAWRSGSLPHCWAWPAANCSSRPSCCSTESTSNSPAACHSPCRYRPCSSRSFATAESFQVLRGNVTFVSVMAAGSIAGTVAEGLLLGVVPGAVLIPVLVAVLVGSAIKVWYDA